MDIRQTFTDNIIALLEQRPQHAVRARWAKAGRQGMPRNRAAGAAYKGTNVCILWEAAITAGHASNDWLTYRQASVMGGQVRKGEKGTLCCYFDVVAKRSAPGSDDSASDDEARAHYPMCKPFWVFNVGQVDGLLVEPGERSARQPFEAFAAADQLITATGAVIRHGFDHAGYPPARDEIVLPDPTQFHSPADYYAPPCIN